MIYDTLTRNLHQPLPCYIWHRYLPCYIWPMIPDTGTCHDIFEPWYLTPVLAMLYLTLIYDTGTSHAIFDIWYVIPVLAMLYLLLDIRYRYLPCYTWPLYMTPVLAMIYLTPDTCITWHMHDYYIFTRHLVLLYSCISCTHTLVNSTVRPVSSRACLVSGWRGCIPQSC